MEQSMVGSCVNGHYKFVAGTREMCNFIVFIVCWWIRREMIRLWLTYSLPQGIQILCMLKLYWVINNLFSSSASWLTIQQCDCEIQQELQIIGKSCCRKQGNVNYWSSWANRDDLQVVVSSQYILLLINTWLWRHYGLQTVCRSGFCSYQV